MSTIPINASAPVTTSQSIDIHAPALKIWTIVAKVDQWPQWQPEISSAKLEGPLSAGSVFRWKSSGMKIRSVFHDLVPGAKIGWTGKAFGAYAIHNWTFTEREGVTTVHVSESMEGWLVGLISGIMKKGLDKGTVVWLQALKRKVEG